MSTIAFLASLLVITAEDDSKPVKMIDGVPVSAGYAAFYEQLSEDESEVPEEISDALEYFVGEWKARQGFFGESRPHAKWSVRRGGNNHVIFSTIQLSMLKDDLKSSKRRKILIGWDAKENRVKCYSSGAHSHDEYISFEVRSPNKWVSTAFKGEMLMPPLREILLEKSGPDEFVITKHYNMMAPTSRTKFARVIDPLAKFTPRVRRLLQNMQPTVPAAELAILQRMVGTWKTEAIIKKAKWTLQESRVTTTDVVEPVLSRQFVQIKSFNDQGDLADIQMFTFDLFEETYRWWTFNSDGGAWTRTGSWNESSQTFTFNRKFEGDSTEVVVIRFVDENTKEFTVISTTEDGHIGYHMEGKSVREK